MKNSLKTLEWEEAIVIFGFFRFFLINMESFRVQCFVPQFSEAFKDSRLDKSLGTFYESLKKYGAKNIKKVINLLSVYINIIHIWKEKRTSFPLQKTRSDLNDYIKRYKSAKVHQYLTYLDWRQLKICFFWSSYLA